MKKKEYPFRGMGPGIGKAGRFVSLRNLIDKQRTDIFSDALIASVRSTSSRGMPLRRGRSRNVAPVVIEVAELIRQSLLELDEDRRPFQLHQKLSYRSGRRSRLQQLESLVRERLKTTYDLEVNDLALKPSFTMRKNAEIVVRTMQQKGTTTRLDLAMRQADPLSSSAAIIREGVKPRKPVSKKTSSASVGTVKLELASDIPGSSFNPGAQGAPLSRGTTSVPDASPASSVICMPQMENLVEVTALSLYYCNLFLDQNAANAGADIQPLTIQVPPDLKQFSVDVRLECSSHFVVTIDAPAALTYVIANAASNKLPITIQLRDASIDLPMFVAAYFDYAGRPSGRIIRYLSVASGHLEWLQRATPDAPASPPKTALVPRDNAPTPVAVYPEAKAADIAIVVRRDLISADTYRITARTANSVWGEGEEAWKPRAATDTLIRGMMTDFIGAQPEARAALLLGAGRQFWNMLPDAFRAWLWQQIKNTSVASISVLSEEPSVPWELMHPNVGAEDLPLLGVKFQVGRWLSGDYALPKQSIPFQTGYIICPTDSNLTNAAAELEFLTHKIVPPFSPVDPLLPATYEGVTQGLAGETRNFIHFICHGQSGTSQTLLLEGGGKLISYAMLDIPAFRKAMSSSPIVFLNACQVGGQNPTLDGIGGFANYFIELGAAAVVAPLWSVSDKVAFDVTQMFYNGVLANKTIGSIMQTIRAKAFETGQDSYAAYCFYGDPLARIAPREPAADYPGQ